ncbi:MAG: hypothetical protein NC926_08135 [Candidatus Omnitrophica bacterium]|nr:hypothetical protein [Candidatus Omnitrophota bacterium]
MDKINIDELVSELKRIGHKTADDVKKSINDLGFRLLEQIRLGNKDNVYYMLLRCFKANEQKFPNELVEAFKPCNEQYFKILIFSFLAPIIGAKETEGGE